MDSLFVFCFKSCLKGDHDTEYYDVLQIDNSSLASTDLIKKQYKRLSLELHPDKLAQRGVEVTPEQKQRFLRVKEAYDVLSDPRRRRMYDQLGASGLKIIEHPTEVDPLTILRNYQVRQTDTQIDRKVALIMVALIAILHMEEKWKRARPGVLVGCLCVRFVVSPACTVQPEVRRNHGKRLIVGCNMDTDVDC